MRHAQRHPVIMNRAPRSRRSPPGRAAIGFANAAHLYAHLLMLIHPTVVLVLGDEFGLGYGSKLSLAVPGFVLFGAAALPAGWLGDRWSANGMMAVFFIGTGAAAVATGFAQGPCGLAAGLAGIGLFAAIYHPVGTAVVVAGAVNRGRALGLNGFYGSVGVAAAPLVAGALTSAFGWRFAFILPGAFCVATGIAQLAFDRRAAERDDAAPTRPAETVIDRRAAMRGLAILMGTALSIGLVAQAITVGLPKVFEVRVTSVAWAGLMGVSGLATLALCFSMVGQLLGGRLADRFPLKTVYLASYAVMVPAALAAAALGELPLVASCALVMMLTTTGLAAENSMVARYCPPDWHARAYGLKFVMALGVAALAVPMVGAIYDGTGGFFWLFAAIAGFAALVVVGGAFLPAPGRHAPVVAEQR